MTSSKDAWYTVFLDILKNRCSKCRGRSDISPCISNLLRNFYVRQRRITLSGDSKSSLVFVVVLSDEQLVGKASGNGEERATNTSNDNLVTHIPVARGRMVGASWWWRWWAAKRSAVLPKRGWRTTLVVVGSDASSNAKLYPRPVPSTCSLASSCSSPSLAHSHRTALRSSSGAAALR